MSGYREQAAPPLDGPAPLPKGPAGICPACRARAIRITSRINAAGAKNGEATVEAWKGYSDDSPLATPRACTPGMRLKLGWFSRCSEPGPHLHEHCKVCGLDWLTAFAEGP